MAVVRLSHSPAEHKSFARWIVPTLLRTGSRLLLSSARVIIGLLSLVRERYGEV